MHTRTSLQTHSLNLYCGETVEVLSEAEILATLDSNGACEGLPFMPEMRAFCGGVYKVHKRAEKTCCEGSGLRRMQDAVFLDGVRCNGAAHDGCGRQCTIFWKEAWLKRSHGPLTPPPSPQPSPVPESFDPETPYSCQSTALAAATEPLPLWDLSQYPRDLRRGQMSAAEFLRVFGVLLTNKFRRLAGLRDIAGPPENTKNTPVTVLNLQPGDLVEIKSPKEIAATLDPDGKNRGLLFCQEMLRFCGQRARVISRVDRMILEETGRMWKTSNTVLLEGVVCDGRSHRGCTRTSYYLCKEAWLRRV
jgi:hypothetical protein